MRKSWMRGACLAAAAVCVAALHAQQPAGPTFFEGARMIVGDGRSIESADFMVLDANPLEDIRNTQRISEVYLEGRTIDRSGLRATWTTGGKAAN